MNYEGQLEVDQQNKEIFNRITKKHLGRKLIEFYKIKCVV
jgi:hypothetical protein